MNTYERIKETVTVPQVAERYGLHIGRNDMVCCPFHDDTHPSMKLNRDYYYCFGCDAHGDVIDLVGRLLDLPPGKAAQKMCEDFGIRCESPPSRGSPPIQKTEIKDTERCRKALRSYADVLRQWKKEYAPRMENETPHPRYVEACKKLDFVEYEEELLYYTKGTDKAELAADMIKDGGIEWIEYRLRQIQEEDNENRTE